MESSGVTIFETEIGPCGIAWRGQKIVGVEIGDADEKETRYRLSERFPGAEDIDMPSFVSDAIQGVRALLAGADVDFSTTPLALDTQPDLNRQVYEIILELKPGETTTYGAIARRIGDVSLSQAVGYALGKNPFPIIVPCHRVLGANGKVGGFSAAGGTATKLKLLNIERAKRPASPIFSVACHYRKTTGRLVVILRISERKTASHFCWKCFSACLSQHRLKSAIRASDAPVASSRHRSDAS